jgi:hypothetical protein
MLKSVGYMPTSDLQRYTTNTVIEDLKCLIVKLHGCISLILSFFTCHPSMQAESSKQSRWTTSWSSLFCDPPSFDWRVQREQMSPENGQRVVDIAEKNRCMAVDLVSNIYYTELLISMLYRIDARKRIPHTFVIWFYHVVSTALINNVFFNMFAYTNPWTLALYCSQHTSL